MNAARVTSGAKTAGKVAFLFPGSGSQYPGMGKSLFEKRASVRKAILSLEKELGYTLKNHMFGGTDEKLFPEVSSPTPTIFIEVSSSLSLSVAKALVADSGIFPAAAAGRSMGEYAAFCFSGVFKPVISFFLLRSAIYYAQMDCIRNPSSLVTVYGLSRQDLEEIKISAEKLDYRLETAIYYDPPRLAVIGLENKGLEHLKSLLAEKKLTISREVGAFHTSIMDESVSRMSPLWRAFRFSVPLISLYTNLTGKRENDPSKLRENILLGLSGRVLWQETLENMIRDGIEIFVELAPGAMLTEFLCELPARAKVLRTDTPENYEKTVNELRKLL